MGIIEHHRISGKRFTEEEICDDMTRFGDILLPRLKSRQKVNIGAVFNRFYRHVAESQTLGHPGNEVFTFLYYAHQLGIAMFKLAANPGKEVVVRFGDTDVSAIGKETRDYVHPAHWCKVFRLSIILRDLEGYKLLKSIDNTIMLRSNVSADSYNIAEVNFLKKINSKSKHEKIQLLNEALIHASNPHYVKTGFIPASEAEKVVDQGRIDVIQLLFKPILYIYEKIFEEDSAGLNKLVKEYLIRYKNSIIKNKEETNSYYWLAYPLLPALAFAHDQGMRIDVESDYIPAWLYKGEFEGLKGQLVC